MTDPAAHPHGGVAVDVHAHASIPAAEAIVSGEPGLARARADEARATGAESARRNLEQIGAIAGKLVDPAARLSDMDTMGIGRQLVSPLPIHHYWAEPGLAERYARATNEGIAAHCAADPHRLAGLATVPLQHPDLAVAELTRAMESDGLLGVEVGTRPGGRELADPVLEPFWARAEELGALVFIHPWGCSLGERLDRFYLSNVVGNPTETTVALSHLIFGGVLDRYPRLTVIAAHGGGYLPVYSGRSDHAWHARSDSRTCAHPPSSYLRRMWFDSLVYTPGQLRALVDAVGADRVLIGTDYPFDMGVTDPLDRLAQAGLPDDAQQLIRGRTATALLGRAD